MCCIKNNSNEMTRLRFDLLLIPRSNSSIENKGVDGAFVGFIGQVFLNEDAKLIFYFIG